MDNFLNPNQLIHPEVYDIHTYIHVFMHTYILYLMVL